MFIFNRYTLSKFVHMWDNTYSVSTAEGGVEQGFTQHILSHVLPSTFPIIKSSVNGSEQQTAFINIIQKSGDVFKTSWNWCSDRQL